MPKAPIARKMLVVARPDGGIVVMVETRDNKTLSYQIPPGQWADRILDGCLDTILGVVAQMRGIEFRR